MAFFGQTTYAASFMASEGQQSLDELLAECAPTLDLGEIAERSGVIPKTLYSWRHGAHRPHKMLLAGLANALGVDVQRVADAIAESRRRRSGPGAKARPAKKRTKAPAKKKTASARGKRSKP